MSESLESLLNGERYRVMLHSMWWMSVADSLEGMQILELLVFDVVVSWDVCVYLLVR